MAPVLDALAQFLQPRLPRDLRLGGTDAGFRRFPLSDPQCFTQVAALLARRGNHV